MHRSTNQYPYSHRARRADWNVVNEAHTSSSRYGEQRYFDEPTSAQTEELRPPPTLQENDGHVDQLRSKLGVLKDDHDFQATGNKLAATMKRFYHMAATQGGAYMWLLCLFAVAVCIFLYLYLKWLG
ncbi:protein transport protein bet1 [Dispira simplex]|nr:protein transport protein bet1 [Dispira simplex]